MSLEQGVNWVSILATTAVQGALIVALGFLARSIILHWLSKDLDSHKVQLTAQSQLLIEQFKGDLSRQVLEHQVRFEASHAGQVAAIESLHVRLVETAYAVRSFVNAWRADNEEEFRQVGKVVFELRHELDKRRIHLPEPLCAELDECIAALWKPAVLAGVWPGVTNPEYSSVKSQEFMKAMQAILEGGSVDLAVKNVERAFRKALREPANPPLQPTSGTTIETARG